jgi:hypothetical protein
MGDDETTSVEIINTMEAQEKAQAMLTKARSRKKREMHMEKERHQQMINIEGDTIMSAKGGNDNVEQSVRGPSSASPIVKPR